MEASSEEEEEGEEEESETETEIETEVETEMVTETEMSAITNLHALPSNMRVALESWYKSVLVKPLQRML